MRPKKKIDFVINAKCTENAYGHMVSALPEHMESSYTPFRASGPYWS